jgi:hypothetical protein
LSINGQRFRDWTSVTVQHRWIEGFPIFKFECTEKEPLPPQWRLLQFKEGDGVEVEFFTKMDQMKDEALLASGPAAAPGSVRTTRSETTGLRIGAVIRGYQTIE